MRSPLVVAVAAVVILVAAVAGGELTLAQTSSARAQGALRASAVKQIPTLEDRVLVVINDVRRQHRLAPLRLDAELAETAREHSLSMAQGGYFRHSSSGGSSFEYRIGKLGSKRSRLGENLVWASPGLSAQEAIRLWLNSPLHRQNLLEPVWRRIGLGAVHADPAPGIYDGLAATILTADFGTRR
jgi:uncharacterized protein YkwD